MNAKKFDEAVSAAFGFLVEEHGYVAEPSPQPQHFLQPNSKFFRNGELSIAFHAGYDLPICRGSSFSSEEGSSSLATHRLTTACSRRG